MRAQTRAHTHLFNARFVLDTRTPRINGSYVQISVAQIKTWRTHELKEQIKQQPRRFAASVQAVDR